jgi:hypothetical protein
MYYIIGNLGDCQIRLNHTNYFFEIFGYFFLVYCQIDWPASLFYILPQKPRLVQGMDICPANSTETVFESNIQNNSKNYIRHQFFYSSLEGR